MPIFELNLDGLVGPTHHYAGLGSGNLASIANAHIISNPQEAALQGLAKMRLLHQLGLKQAIMPPHQRPNLALLFQLGFTGNKSSQLEKASCQAPELLSACFSASSMWTANAATVSPSLDTGDNRVHFTAANLLSNLHRHQEADFNRYLLEKLFADSNFFSHHPVLPKNTITADEGAANHSRLSASHATPGIHLFTYGKKALSGNQAGPLKFPARQTLEASEAIVRSHQLSSSQVLFACQNPKAIDQGAFHNDIVAVANEFILFLHEEAFSQQQRVLAELKNKANFQIQVIETPSSRISLKLAIQTYLFNSQLVTLANQRMALIAPIECKENPLVKDYLDELVEDKQNPIASIHYLNLRQSMLNGGGVACLRLRILLKEQELKAMHQGILLTEPLFKDLELWVKKHYRSQLKATDFADPSLIDESFSALEELCTILQLGRIYPFQRE